MICAKSSAILTRYPLFQRRFTKIKNVEKEHAQDSKPLYETLYPDISGLSEFQSRVSEFVKCPLSRSLTQKPWYPAQLITSWCMCKSKRVSNKAKFAVPWYLQIYCCTLPDTEVFFLGRGRLPHRLPTPPTKVLSKFCITIHLRWESAIGFAG